VRVEGIAVLVATHDPPIEEHAHAVHELRGGRIAA
jgi:ABC-type lipoprotein export system ATPase subunit